MAIESFTKTVIITEEGYECLVKAFKETTPFVYERSQVIIEITRM